MKCVVFTLPFSVRLRRPYSLSVMRVYFDSSLASPTYPTNAHPCRSHPGSYECLAALGY